jgi:hypothetical protein
MDRYAHQANSVSIYQPFVISIDRAFSGKNTCIPILPLVDRRAGIEPLIGHAKHGGQLGQSRMKTDDTTLAAGYAAIGGFSLRQLIRHLLGKDIKPIG